MKYVHKQLKDIRQGGFAVTKNADLAKRMRAIRTHGIENVKDPECWIMPGFNFRFTDVLASIGIDQLKRIPERIERLKNIYMKYADGLRDAPFQLIPVNLNNGEIPVYNEYLIEHRAEWIQRLEAEGIESRPFYPDIDRAPYLDKQRLNFYNSRQYESKGIYLPSGPAQSPKNIITCIEKINAYC